MPYKSDAQRKVVHANKNRHSSAIHSNDILQKPKLLKKQTVYIKFPIERAEKWLSNKTIVVNPKLSFEGRLLDGRSVVHRNGKWTYIV